MIQIFGCGSPKFQNNWESQVLHNEQLLPRERKKQEYLGAVKERYKHLPEVKRIVRHRHLPKPIYKAGNLRHTMIESENRKEERRRKHSSPGSMPVQSFRKRRIIKEVESLYEALALPFSALFLFISKSQSYLNIVKFVLAGFEKQKESTLFYVSVETRNC
ncbi:uncharacterized protein LOC133891952 isoform X1 [Phragmites australis]|uniref:uncharacterized protein LOC133891952 isoform X1 n=1 Tax=Phragmites australis TaxID=29695 RepID=UPI002D79B9CB|nr:uncharacterized protein LOC133891952 isoform X1 [Phragmites australis]XP_062188667.1 uncharacterized protein LOC133891952 isoform X1 [Phragmites australis]